MEGHCKEHEDRTICMVKMKRDLDNMVVERKEKLKRMQTEADMIWTTLKDKLDTKAFYWCMGTLVMVMMVVLGVQWNLLFNIDTKVDDIAIKQAVIQSTLEKL